MIINYRDRPEGSQSKLNTYSDGFRVLRRIFNLYRDYHPMRFFTIISALLFIIAGIVFVPEVLIPYLKTGLVEKMPTLVVCIFLGIAGIVSWYSGLVLDSVLQKEKREFEFRLQLIREKFNGNHIN